MTMLDIRNTQMMRRAIDEYFWFKRRYNWRMQIPLVTLVLIGLSDHGIGAQEHAD